MDFLTAMKDRFKDIARGAALMTGTKECLEEVKHSYKPGKPNIELNKAFMTLAKERGMKPEWLEPSRASSDFGDVTYEVPAIHVFFNITGEQKDIACHSPEFTQCAISGFAQEQMGKTAQILSQIGYMFLTKKDFRKTVIAAFPFDTARTK